jgi:hypothetical protein
MNESTKRAFFRIRYPLSERPRLRVENCAYDVIDCSLKGLRYVVPRGPLPPLGAEIKGRVYFRRGAEVNVKGVVLRVQDKEVALDLSTTNIPFSILLDEQRYLHTRYPMWS